MFRFILLFNLSFIVGVEYESHRYRPGGRRTVYGTNFPPSTRWVQIIELKLSS